MLAVRLSFPGVYTNLRVGCAVPRLQIALHRCRLVDDAPFGLGIALVEIGLAAAGRQQQGQDRHHAAHQ